MSMAPRAISSPAPLPQGPSGRALVRLALSVCTRYPAPPRGDMAQLASGYGHRGSAGRLMPSFARNRQAVRSRAISLVAYGLSCPPREPASLAARCPPTVTGSYLAGLAALTQLGRHSISASKSPSWK